MENGSDNKRRDSGDKLDLGLTSIISVPYKQGDALPAEPVPEDLPPIQAPEPLALKSIDLEKVIKDVAAGQNGAETAKSDPATSFLARSRVDEPPRQNDSPPENRPNEPISLGLTELAGEGTAPPPFPKEKLDLGLADLVKKEGSPVEDKKPEIPGRRTPDAPIELSTSTALALTGTVRYSSSYRQLAEMNRWAEITSDCEARLEEAEDPEAKVWWIYSQYKQNAMPISILASPLNEVSRAMIADGSGSKDLRALLSALLLEFSQVLKRGGDFETALSFLERSVDLDGGNGAPKKADPKKTVPAAEQKPAPRVARSEPKPVAPPVRPSTTRTAVSQASQTAPLPPLEDSHASPEGEKRKFVWATAAFVAIALLIGGDFYLNGRRAIIGLFEGQEDMAELQDLPPMIEEKYAKPVTNPPQTERFTRVSQLNALFYDMDRAAHSAGPSAAPAGQQQGGPAAQPAPAQASAPQTAQPPQAQLPAAAQQQAQSNQKAVIDTSYPPESDAIRMMDRSGVEKKTEVAQIDFPPYRQAGRPRPRNDQRLESRYPRGRVFTVLYRTIVRQTPASNGVELDTLREGERVVVVGRVGDWFELESKRGVGGYIPVRDADDGYVP